MLQGADALMRKIDGGSGSTAGAGKSSATEDRDRRFSRAQPTKGFPSLILSPESFSASDGDVSIETAIGVCNIPAKLTHTKVPLLAVMDKAGGTIQECAKGFVTLL